METTSRRHWGSCGPPLAIEKRCSERVAAIYYELPLSSERLLERSTLGPRGTGRVVVDGSLIPNPIPGLPTAPIGRPVNFQTVPTHFTGAHLLSSLPSARGALLQQFGNPDNADLSVRNIELFKQGTGILAQDLAGMAGSVGIENGSTSNTLVGAAYGRSGIAGQVGTAAQYQWDNDVKYTDYRGQNKLPTCVSDTFAVTPGQTAWTPFGGSAIYIDPGRLDTRRP